MSHSCLRLTFTIFGPLLAGLAIQPAAAQITSGTILGTATDASGSVQTGAPNQNGVGSIVQGSLEASNVEPVQQLIDLITTQRSFEMNSQVIQAGDQMLEDIVALSRNG